MLNNYSIDNPKKVVILNNGIDFNLSSDDFVRITTQRLVSDLIEIVFLGRIEEDKGIRETLRAFQNIKHNNCRLNIIGSGPIL